MQILGHGRNLQHQWNSLSLFFGVVVHEAFQDRDGDNDFQDFVPTSAAVGSGSRRRSSCFGCEHFTLQKGCFQAGKYQLTLRKWQRWGWHGVSCLTDLGLLQPRGHLNFVDLVSSSAFPAAADILLSYSFGRKRSEITQLINFMQEKWRRCKAGRRHAQKLYGWEPPVCRVCTAGLRRDRFIPGWTGSETERQCYCLQSVSFLVCLSTFIRCLASARLPYCESTLQL